MCPDTWISFWITLEAESFNDEGFGPPPAKWKGSCGTYANFSGCNNKIMGAKYFNLVGTVDPADVSSPMDFESHGTRMPSTLAGRVVEGITKGVGRGAVPSARIAMYKVCLISSGWSDMDLLAGFDAAIDDRDDLISISIGGYEGSYITDTIAISSFHAMKRGILTLASAGNSGPTLNSVTNHAPWALTVAASSSDR